MKKEELKRKLKINNKLLLILRQDCSIWITTSRILRDRYKLKREDMRINRMK